VSPLSTPKTTPKGLPQCTTPSQLITIRFEGYPNNRIVYVVDDDEIALYTGFYDLPTRVDDFLDLFNRHQKYFVGFLVIMFFTEIALLYSAYIKTDQAVVQVRSCVKSNENSLRIRIILRRRLL
jgi:hypothetical protein